MSHTGGRSPQNAGMVELVDTPDLGSGAERYAGSSPVPGTFTQTTTTMQELQDKLAALGLSQEQSAQAIQTVVDFIKSKVPAEYQGMVDQVMEGHMPDLGSLGGLMGGLKGLFGGDK